VLLGVWESVNFPICLLIIRRIFPAAERALAAGALGFLWLVPWFLIFRHPERRAPEWTAASLASPPSRAGERAITVASSLRTVLSAPGFWGVASMGLGIIPSLYFATQWFPSFFTQALAHPYDQSLAYRLSLIYFMQDVGLWGGGALVLGLTHRGVSILSARKAVIITAYVLMMGVIAAPFVRAVDACVLILCLYVCGIGAFLGNQHAFKQDVDKRQVATVAALVGAIETGFTAFVIKRIGVVSKDTLDFAPVFFSLAGLATFALIVACVFLRPKWFRIE
jgi:hypothetical protein